MQKFWLLGLSLIAASVHAEEATPSESDIEVPSPWDTEVEFGYQSHSGNTDSESLNSRLSAQYTSGPYRINGEWKYYQVYKDGEEDKRQSNYSAQADYKLSKKTYLYGSFKGVDSRYSAYFKDYTLSGGLGYQFANTDAFVLEVEAGPGYRYQEPNLDEIDDDDIVFPNIVEEGIFRGKINTAWQALDTLRFEAELTAVAGRSNTSLESDINIINNITEDIALKLSHDRIYHDRVPEGLSKADSIFSVNLLFIF
ncbi:porin [Vibrio sp. V39_P1S14PM300]|uniref:porin n=1 Tax=Vibrio sp. V39_P1S14PM300 TaxID=1938690 RepID=UPI001372F49F|nr:porin [Vibrio sp. V39_P1S14PM300]